MCGIHLIIQKSGEAVAGNDAIQRMIQSLGHRGPDGSSHLHLDWGMEQIWLGHNLLAISDTVSKARQPMVTADGKCGVLFNGQIYNHKELRLLLEAENVEFQTGSDTEVLLHWLCCKGRKGLRQLTGMFAFVFWNSEKQLLLIHRDGYGIKPLYYARNRQYFVVSSEPKGILASDLFKFSSDYQSIGYYLKYKFIPDPQSPWLGIKALQPGEAVEYWESKPMHYRVQAELPNVEKRTIQEVINIGFQDVIPKNEPVGLMVSGGIDSSLIWHWCIENGVDVIPFSIRFPGLPVHAKSDQRAVEHLALQFKREVHWVDIENDAILGITNFVKKDSALVADSAWFLTDKIAKRASEMGIRVLLSGAGADEWFGGYRRHWYFHQWKRFGDLVPDKWQFQILKKVLDETLEWQGERNLLPQTIWDVAVALPLGQQMKTQLVLSIQAQSKELSYLANAFLWDQKQYLVNDILNITDLGTMAQGVEGRFPFLHPAITGFAESFLPEHHLKNGRKWMLRELVEAFAGKTFVNRKKQGLGLPMPYLFESQPGKEWMENFLNRKSHLFERWFSPEVLSQLQRKAEKRPEFWAQQVFAICWLGEWLECNG